MAALFLSNASVVSLTREGEKEREAITERGRNARIIIKLTQGPRALADRTKRAFVSRRRTKTGQRNCGTAQCGAVRAGCERKRETQERLKERRGRGEEEECKHESFTTAEYVKRESRAIHRSHVATYTPRLARSLIMARIEELFIYLVQ